MSGKDFVELSLIAFGKGTTVGGALTTTFIHGGTMAYIGAGIVDLTLDAAVGFAVAAGYIMDLDLLTNGVSQKTITDTSAQVKRLSFFASAAGAGAAAESAFQFKVWRRLTS